MSDNEVLNKKEEAHLSLVHGIFFLHQLLHQLLKGIVGNISSSLPKMWRPFLCCFKPQIDCDWTLSTQVMQSIKTPAARKNSSSSSHKLLSSILLRILLVGRHDRTNGFAWVSLSLIHTHAYNTLVIELSLSSNQVLTSNQWRSWTRLNSIHLVG